MPLSTISRFSTVVASRCANVACGAGSVMSSAGTYTACSDVIERPRVEVMRSCSSPISSVSVGRRHASEQRRYLRSRLREPEDVVDEQQHVLTFLIAKVLGDRERGQTD